MNDNLDGTLASVSVLSETYQMLQTLTTVLAKGEQPKEYVDSNHHLEITYHEDEDGEYALVGYVLPDNVYAEIDGRTYGELQGFRIYLNDLV